MQRTIAGFRFGGVTCGIKESGRPDLALLVADEDVPVAAVFTRNRVKAAPVLLSQERAKRGLARGVVVNSGNANACTGARGAEDAAAMSHAVSSAIGADDRRMLVASTGVIGVPLPVEKIVRAAPALAAAARADAGGFEEFSQAILTTDKGPKVASAEVTLGQRRARLLGCTKGAGMIAPNMATTLAFVATDAAVDGRWLRATLKEEAEATFNEVSVDGDTSTNDSLFVFASGRAGNAPVGGSAHGRAFRAALHEVLEDLALQIVRDGEGATRVVTIEVAGADDERSARAVARRVAGSPLVKAALFGADPNWGRILCAVGNAGVDVDPARIDVSVGGVALVRGGVAVGDGADERAHAVMQGDRFPIRIHLHRGRATARHVTCDLSYDY